MIFLWILFQIFFSCMYTQIYNSILRPAPSRLGRQNSVPYREQSYDSGRWFKMLPFPRNLISGQKEPSQAGTWLEHLLWSIVLYGPPLHDSDSLFWPLLISRGLSSILQGQSLIAPLPERALLPLQGWGMRLRAAQRDQVWGSELTTKFVLTAESLSTYVLLPRPLYHSMRGKLRKEKTDVTKG